jgi:hypothetical protein
VGGSQHKLPGPGGVEGDQGPEYIAYAFFNIGLFSKQTQHCAFIYSLFYNVFRQFFRPATGTNKNTWQEMFAMEDAALK